MGISVCWCGEQAWQPLWSCAGWAVLCWVEETVRAVPHRVSKHVMSPQPHCNCTATWVGAFLPLAGTRGPEAAETGAQYDRLLVRYCKQLAALLGDQGLGAGRLKWEVRKRHVLVWYICGLSRRPEVG